jgi:hypothetical protein
MTGRLDFGNFQNLLKVMRNKVTNPKTNAFQSSIINEILQDGPEFSNLAFLCDVWRMDQEKVGFGSESINGFLDGFLDVFKFGWEVWLLAMISSGIRDLPRFFSHPGSKHGLPSMWGDTVDQRLRLSGDRIGERTLGSDPDSIPLYIRSINSFPSFFLGTVSLLISISSLSSMLPIYVVWLTWAVSIW